MLNRLLTADFKSYSGGAWIDPGAMYNASYSYDPNGNIRTLTRDGSQSNPGPMDNLTYEYTSLRNAGNGTYCFNLGLQFHSPL